MAEKYSAGDKIYIIESNRTIREATVLKSGGGFYTIRFTDTGGGIKVRENRIYESKEEAEAVIPQKTSVKHRTPYDFM